MACSPARSRSTSLPDLDPPTHSPNPTRPGSSTYRLAPLRIPTSPGTLRTQLELLQKRKLSILAELRQLPHKSENTNASGSSSTQLPDLEIPSSPKQNRALLDCLSTKVERLKRELFELNHQIASTELSIEEQGRRALHHARMKQRSEGDLFSHAALCAGLAGASIKAPEEEAPP